MPTQVLSIAERHAYILKSLKKEGKITVPDLSRALNISMVTARKDIRMLEEKNLLFRVHGGATIHNPYPIKKYISGKEQLRISEKTRIGAAAAALIETEDCIIIGSGTTVQFLARALDAPGKLTVITASLNVASEINLHTNVEVHVLGGMLRKSSSTGTGLYAEKMLEDFSCSKLFLGVDGIDFQSGITTTHAMEAQLNRKMISTAQKIIVLADSSKFGKKGFGKICGLEEIDQLITDKGISSAALAQLKGMGIEVTIV